MCQQRRWALKGVDWGVPHRLDKGTSANEDAGPRRRVDCEITSVGEENETFFIREWILLPSRCILKTLRGNPKGKTQKGQYRLAVGLGGHRI